MGNKIVSENLNSVDDIVTKLNEELSHLPKMGCYFKNEFLNNSEKIKMQLEKSEVSAGIVDKIIKLNSDQSNLKVNDPLYFELESEMQQLINQIPNPIVDENDEKSKDFWLKIYNLFIYNVVSNLKFSTRSNLKNVLAFNNRIQKLPNNVTLNQINLQLNYVLHNNSSQIKNFYQIYLNDEKEIVRLLFDQFYAINRSYTGMTSNLEVLNCFSDKVKNLIFMHIILDNKLDLYGDVKFLCNDDCVKLPESIEESDQYLAIDNFDDMLDAILFRTSSKYDNLSFLRQSPFKNFVKNNSEYFNKSLLEIHEK